MSKFTAAGLSKFYNKIEEGATPYYKSAGSWFRDDRGPTLLSMREDWWAQAQPNIPNTLFVRVNSDGRLETFVSENGAKNWQRHPDSRVLKVLVMEEV